ncbi:hypothetical protein DSO57_1037882 [Entomophthora muscae]|uniref:Uncharacterized protein n=1 Tax=Entomophthora muscae TaxID=34485 RepID=A0ACC2SBZ2_9FUNG|nr:hypothetical protein DSO57_1037882 [Entomophthora muscae]
MLGFPKAIVSGLLLLEQGACQMDSGAFDSMRGMSTGFLGLRKLIGSAVKLSNSGSMGRKSYPLLPPRKDYGITPNDVKYYLKHSMLSVCKPEEIKSNTCFCDGKFEKAKVFRNDTLDSQGVVAVDPKNKLIVVSYRLTVSSKNYATDYDSVLVNYPSHKGQEKVHRGNLIYFKSLHYQMEPLVLSLLRNPRYRHYRLHLTGYSLGAAVAAISLPTWQKILNDNDLSTKIQVYTYAGTRHGNVEFARYLESLEVPIVRYAKRGDAVPFLPDQALGFSQVGLEFYDVRPKPLQRALIRCASDLLEDNTCSLGATNFLAIHHLAPFHQPIPLPPLC